jgi:hypothetical protein
VSAHSHSRCAGIGSSRACSSTASLRPTVAWSISSARGSAQRPFPIERNEDARVVPIHVASRMMQICIIRPANRCVSKGRHSLHFASAMHRSSKLLESAVHPAS